MNKDPKTLKEINQRFEEKLRQLTELNQHIEAAQTTLASVTAAVEAALEGTPNTGTFKLRYSYPGNIPDYITGLPTGAQRIFVEVFNSALDNGKSEDEARIAGWGAVKTTYEKQGEEWVKKPRRPICYVQQIRWPRPTPCTIKCTLSMPPCKWVCGAGKRLQLDH